MENFTFTKSGENVTVKTKNNRKWLFELEGWLNVLAINSFNVVLIHQKETPMGENIEITYEAVA